jgi:hypothetical protein
LFVFEIITEQRTRESKPLPRWLRLIWIFSAPLGLALSARILWEKTLLTAEQGAQSIGFSLIHIHPGFFFGGLLCSMVLLAWLLPAGVYLAVARLRIGLADYAMILGSLLVLATMMLPDNFGLRLR